VLGVLLAFGLLGPCREDESALLNAAVANGLEADTLEYTHREEFSTPDGRRAVLTGQGVFDSRIRRARGTYDYSQLPGFFERRDSSAFERVVFVLDGAIGYVRIEKLAGRARPWLRLDFARLGKASSDPTIRLFGDALSSPMGPDPARLLDDLIKEVGELDEVGEEQLNVVPTTRFRGEIPVEPLLEGTGIDLTEARAAIGNHMVIQVWVDRFELPRRLRMETERRGGYLLEETYSDFDVDIDIRLPPRRRVQELSAVPEAAILLGLK